MRLSVAIIVASVGLAVTVIAPGMVTSAHAQSGSEKRVGRVANPHAQDSAQRPRVRIYRNTDRLDVSPRYNPGPNAVRDCRAQLVQEFRPSGTVIVPRMDCYWVRG